LGLASNAFDGDALTFWQSTCGRHTVNQETQPDISVVLVCSNIDESRSGTANDPNLMQPYLEATFSASKAIRCIKLTQTPIKYSRRVNKIDVRYYHISSQAWVSQGIHTYNGNSATWNLKLN